jgi:ribonuclease P protein component
MPTSIPEPAEIEKGARTRAARFRKTHRLAKHEVIELLRVGARFSRAELVIKISENSVHCGRLAIAVPKRILKSAVERNTVKRVIREEFRRHAARVSPADMLVTLRSATPRERGTRPTDRSGRRQLRQSLTQLLADVARRFAARA